MAERIAVATPDGSYDITIAPGAIAQIADHAADFGLAGRTAVITDSNVAPLYGDALLRTLPDAALIVMPAGEQSKTLATVADFYRQLVTAGIDRYSTIVALGGGVVGDAAGFAAATYLRGIRFVQMPTSLLAMVDSSVGGKVGVDLPEGKNLVGAFKQPDAVLIDPAVLVTLPAAERACGCAEILKHGLLADPGLLEAVAALAALPSPSPADFAAVIRQAVAVKVDVVQRDPYEQNIRAHLNLGHTFGHAVEQVSGYAWRHGEAVGVGLVAAARLSHALAMIPAALADQVEGLVRAVGLPTRIGALDVEAIYAAMATDKKWRAGKSRFVLLRGIGQPEIVAGVPPETVIAVLDSLRGDA